MTRLEAASIVIVIVAGIIGWTSGMLIVHVFWRLTKRDK